MTDTIALAEGFRPVDRLEWHRCVAGALARTRGDVAPDAAERLLTTPTEDGYSVKGLYTAEDVADLPPPADPGRTDFIRGSRPATGAGWEIRQRHRMAQGDPESAIAEDLANGVAGLWLVGEEPDVAQAFLTGVDLAAVPVVVQGFRASADMARALLRAAGTSPVNPSSSLGLDPLGLLAGTGRLGDLDDAMDLAGEAASRGMLAFTVDGAVYSDAGASFGEELGAGTAAGVATLRMLVDAGIPVSRAARLIEFRWVVSDDQFASIAKLRAARVIWDRVLQIAGAERDQGQRQHAVTSAAMLTARDPWVNLVRNCVAAFAGGVGGASAVTVLPHTLATGTVDDFSRRMARNTQHLLLAESLAGFVADPGGGSYYVERRTRQLAEAAWSFLRELEAAGGLRIALESGMVAERIERTWQLKRDRIARRTIPITGVSEFPDRSRSLSGVEGRSLSGVEGRSDTPSTDAGWRRPGGGLPQRRFAEDFERLRDRADAAPQPPTVVLVTLGSLARFGARETFATNLFAAGGIATSSVPFALRPGSGTAPRLRSGTAPRLRSGTGGGSGTEGGSGTAPRLRSGSEGGSGTAPRLRSGSKGGSGTEGGSGGEGGSGTEGGSGSQGGSGTAAGSEIEGDLALPAGTRVVCLCGADADYPELAPPAAAAAKAAGVTTVWLAGKPGSRAEADAAAGIDGHLYAGCDAITVLERTLADLEVPQ